MRRVLTPIARAIEWLNDLIGRGTSWLTLLLVGVTFTIVIMRYLFDSGSIALQEATLYLHATLFMLGAAYTLRHDGHVRVDILYRQLGERGRAIIDLVGALILLIPFSLFILYSSWDYVATSWQLREGSRDSGGLPWLYLLKSTLIAFGLLMLLQGIAQAIRQTERLMGASEKE
jgi:TRAP-type mannitol/chloroaromatic compound transport system permease small subunit